MFKYYGASYVVTAICLAIGYWLGGLPGLAITFVLGVLETSLSFDNAIVNASVLKHWDERWRQYFLRYGLPIAVFGMRFVFPLAIVSIAVGVNPIEAFNLATGHPEQYEQIMKSVHHEVAAFGGVFLLMVFLQFFFDHEKDVHWVHSLETIMSKMGAWKFTSYVIAAVIVVGISYLVPAIEQAAVLYSGFAGLATFACVKALGTWTGGDDTGSKIIKQGIMGLMYLELVDASFSFDGVIAAFALTNNIFIMTAGLMIGAMFVRSMTLHLVDKGTLAEFRYLEHSAFWAIGVLAACMFTSLAVHVPEVITGLTGAGLIGIGIWTSIRAKKYEEANNV